MSIAYLASTLSERVFLGSYPICCTLIRRRSPQLWTHLLSVVYFGPTVRRVVTMKSASSGTDSAIDARKGDRWNV